MVRAGRPSIDGLRTSSSQQSVQAERATSVGGEEQKDPTVQDDPFTAVHDWDPTGGEVRLEEDDSHLTCEQERHGTRPKSSRLLENRLAQGGGHKAHGQSRGVVPVVQNRIQLHDFEAEQPA